MSIGITTLSRVLILKMKLKKFLKVASEWAVLAGALNWGLIVFNFNLVQWLSSLINQPVLTAWIYGIIGASAIYQIVKKIRG